MAALQEVQASAQQHAKRMALAPRDAASVEKVGRMEGCDGSGAAKSSGDSSGNSLTGGGRTQIQCPAAFWQAPNLSLSVLGGAFRDWDFGVPVAQAFFLPDYVSPLFAQYLGLAAQVEVGVVASILPPTLDPRIAAVEDDFPSIQAFAHTAEPPGCPGTGASSSMDSIARVEPFLEHSVVEPGVSFGLGCPEILVHSLNQSGSSCWVGCTKRRSCLKSLSNPAPVKAKQVTFAYSVDFWFPGPLQFSFEGFGIASQQSC